ATMNLGILHRDLRRWPEAVTYWTEAVPLADGLLTDHEDRMRQGLCLSEWGRALAGAGKKTEALDAYDRALKVQTKVLAERDATFTDWERLADTQYRRAELLADMGRTADARNACKDLLTLTDAWEKRQPGGEALKVKARANELLARIE